MLSAIHRFLFNNKKLFNIIKKMHPLATTALIGLGQQFLGSILKPTPPSQATFCLDTLAAPSSLQRLSAQATPAQRLEWCQKITQDLLRHPDVRSRINTDGTQSCMHLKPHDPEHYELMNAKGEKMLIHKNSTLGHCAHEVFQLHKLCWADQQRYHNSGPALCPECFRLTLQRT
jgi:hypothetical protein